MELNERWMVGVYEVKDENGKTDFILRSANTGISRPPMITVLENFLRNLRESYEKDFDSGMKTS